MSAQVDSDFEILGALLKIEMIIVAVFLIGAILTDFGLFVSGLLLMVISGFAFVPVTGLLVIGTFIIFNENR